MKPTLSYSILIYILTILSACSRPNSDDSLDIGFDPTTIDASMKSIRETSTLSSIDIQLLNDYARFQSNQTETVQLKYSDLWERATRSYEILHSGIAAEIVEPVFQALDSVEKTNFRYSIRLINRTDNEIESVVGDVEFRVRGDEVLFLLMGQEWSGPLRSGATLDGKQVDWNLDPANCQHARLLQGVAGQRGELYVRFRPVLIRFANGEEIVPFWNPIDYF
jgi:hypothetical protein